ncbi:YHS domain protein [Enterovibrio norvegicus FF-33]|uniref:YHS domain protein n=1 Tax=Enterovibrio norvegicus FF-454 TaxID=1185651 RepID=A0A1E5C7L4_9GAMM|nr:YHS domain-containing (seleno)protein [Enterovibrio norvegicus]OEE61476.1 YHS domain protein [Enterovibrio norvegicus FF-454]OEE66175.1 YHS domain protein [Enterovibrio norvegicus FF-33]OEE74231.1 YHS domain protein [Enterovibrio norvegicus FF-162]
MSRILLLISLFFSAATFAAEDVYTGFFSNKAVSGYDTVSYFEGGPVQGKSDFKTEYQGAEWLFSSQANLDKFLANPEQYAPQYGGYCAWAIAEKDDLAPGDPAYWKIVDGKLYLNYDKSIQGKWEKDVPGFISQGDLNWVKR